MPPTGGFGLNTGVQDVHNRTWKIAAVLCGKAHESLLDSYHDERQPAGQLITQNLLSNAMSMGRKERQSNAVLPRPEYLSEQGLIFGACYESMAVLPDGTSRAAPDDPVTEYLPSARPGCRAPHVWLKRGNEQISTIDLIGPHFLLMAGSEGDAWRRAAQGLGTLWPRLIAYTVGEEGDVSEFESNWHAAYDIDSHGAVLVRPDGYVAWRSRSGVSDPLAALHAAFDRLLGRCRPVLSA
jgi:putative polyketide hydroxylase